MHISLRLRVLDIDVGVRHPDQDIGVSLALSETSRNEIKEEGIDWSCEEKRRCPNL
jgi:hypothetical protein